VRSETNLVGQFLLNRYRIDQFLGAGGMAEVYKAWDNKRSYHVALKVMQKHLFQDSHFRHEFRNEAKLLKDLPHPNIVRFYGFEEDHHYAFLVMDYVEGESLRQRLSHLRTPLTISQLLAIIEPVCIALNFAHEEQVIHCDVKPANILISHDNRVLLSDFGIAKLTQDAKLGHYGAGAPAYMAPEQCLGEPLDRRTDVYAVALTTYEMLTLDRPFRGNTTATPGTTADKIQWEQIYQMPPNPTSLNSHIPYRVEQVILRALSKHPADRHPDTLTFFEDLSADARFESTRVAPSTFDSVPPPPRPPQAPPIPSQPPISSPKPKLTFWQRFGFVPPPRQTTPQIYLQMTRGESPGYTYPLTTETISIGRSADNHIRLYHRSVSRQHALIRYGQGRFFLQDQGSTHGTFVNGVSVDAVMLNHGDRIVIGETEFVFVIREA
jgi:serine/threonine-protein kinase